MRVSVYTWGISRSIEPSAHLELSTNNLEEALKLMKVDRNTRSKILRRVRKYRQLVAEHDSLHNKVKDKIHEWCKKTGVEVVTWERRLVLRNGKAKCVIRAEVEKAGVRSIITLGTRNRLPELPKMVEKLSELSEKINNLRREIEDLIREASSKFNDRLKDANDIEMVIRIKDGKLKTFKMNVK